LAARRIGARLTAIHWAQSSELALLEYLAKYVRGAPVMLVAPARPELLDLHPTWGSGLVAQTTIPLDPLEATDAAALRLTLSARQRSTRSTWSGSSRSRKEIRSSSKSWPRRYSRLETVVRFR